MCNQLCEQTSYVIFFYLFLFDFFFGNLKDDEEVMNTQYQAVTAQRARVDTYSAIGENFKIFIYMLA